MTRISSGYNSYSAAALRQILSSKVKSSSSAQSPKSKASLLLDHPSQNTIVNKIEKHISDVKKGNGDASKDVPYLLAQQDANASSILSQTNPRALALYSGYLSGLRYDRAARFVNGIEGGLSSLQEINRIQKESVTESNLPPSAIEQK